MARDITARYLKAFGKNSNLKHIKAFCYSVDSICSDLLTVGDRTKSTIKYFNVHCVERKIFNAIVHCFEIDNQILR